MSEYRIFETDEFLASLTKLSHQNSLFIENKLRDYVYPQLRKMPYFGTNIKKLRGYEPKTWRYRIGRYRIFYLIDDRESVVMMLTAEHRKDAYR